MARDVCIEGGNLHFIATRIMCLIIISLSLIIITSLGITSISQFPKLKKLEPTFKRLFHTVWITATLALILFIISIALCAYGHPYSSGNIIVLQAYCVITIILCILLTLVFRLYFTFKDTTYKLSNCMKWFVITLYSSLLILSAFNAILTSYAYVKRDTVKIKIHVPVMWLGAVMGILYVVTYVIAIAQFANNLLKLTDSRATSLAIMKRMRRSPPNLSKFNSSKLNYVSEFHGFFIYKM